MNHWLLVFIAWIGQLFLFYGRRGDARVATLAGAALDIGAVAWLCTQHQWLIAGRTFAALPLLTAAVLGLLSGMQNNRFEIEKP